MRVTAARERLAEQAAFTVRRVLVLLNSGAGALRKTPIESVQNDISAAFSQHGIAVEIVPVAGADLAMEAAQGLERAECGEIGAVVVAGGDGSVQTVAAKLADTRVPLGILPLGTLNHLAKDLGIPLSIKEAAATIAAGYTRDIDLGEVNGETFINNSSIGIYPYLVIARERRRAAHRFAKWMAMVPAFFRMLRHFPRRRLRISAEGWVQPYRTPCLFVGNNEYTTELLSFGKRPRLDKGTLWFYVVKPRTPPDFFLMIWRLCFSHLDQDRDLDRFTFSAAKIEAKSSRLPVALDGEVKVLRSPLNYRSRPGALRVIAPDKPRA
ncbi:MAG: diacylglycerol/lipid kinase family protein [Methyloceanibacter sp.]